MNRRFWLLFATAAVAVIAGYPLGAGGIYDASASLPGTPGFPQRSGRDRVPSPLEGLQGSSGINVQAPDKPAYDDGFDALPSGLKGLSYSTLFHMGKVHPQSGPIQTFGWKSAFAPLLNIVWGADNQTTTSNSAEPAAGLHPTLFTQYALVSGNTTIDNTTNGGTTWQSRTPPNPSGYGDVVNAWLEPAGPNALVVSLNPSADGADYTCSRSTDFGVTWITDAVCATTARTTFFDDREYLWVDRTAGSPFYGRVYLTDALFDTAGSGSYNSVSIRWSSDNGATWNPPPANPVAIVAGNEFALGQNHNEYPSVGISANGTVGYAWHRGACCGGFSPINAPNKVMFARSTNGGATFPFSTTVVTVPLNQTIPFNSTSPYGTRWSDTPNIAADPNPARNGTFYAIWTQYRTAGTPASAAIYLSRTTDNGATWSAPVIPYNNPNPNLFQGWGWVKVTNDGTVHVTFHGAVGSNSTLGHFYVQSTDGGATWSAPFQVSTSTFSGGFGSTHDYSAMDVSLTGGAGAILATWAQTTHRARLGTFTQGTPTPTATGTPPTVTRTSTRTNTPTATPTVCGASAPYAIATSTGATIVPATTFVAGSNCDDCSSSIPLPFPFRLYDQTFNTVNAISNGNLQFLSADTTFTNTCLPYTAANYAILPHWDDMVLTGAGQGIYTSINGTAPNRVFAIRWTGVYFSGGGTAEFEVLLYENSPTGRFDVIYGLVSQSGSSATIGVQKDMGSVFTQFECNTGGLTTGLMLTFQQPSCPQITATPTRTNTPTAGPTSTVCPITFTDVQPGSTFYDFVRCLACRGIINGYSDNTFRPNNNVTRGQLSKIVSNSAGFSDPQTTRMFQDVPPGSTFFDYIGRLASRGYISGYPCGGAGEPCVPPDNLPYFRTNANATRGQISKIVSNSAGFTDPATGQTFQDVPPGSTFYDFIERLASRGVMGGYPCGQLPTEPCVPPDNRPYFRPNNNATRGQTSKIVANTFFPACVTPGRPDPVVPIR